MSHPIACAMAAYEQALDAAPAARRRIIEQVCRDDAVALEFALEMLDHDECSDDAIIATVEAAMARVGREWPIAIDGFAVEEFLAYSEHCELYAVRPPTDGHVCAMKTLRRDRISDETIDDVAHELDILHRLSHPRIATVLHAGRWRNVPYFTMPLIRGQTFDWFCAGASREQKIIAYAMLCEVVGHIHSCGVVHCDLSPANVMVDELSLPYLIDFGAACTAGDVEGTHRQRGTPGFAAPERRIEGARPDVRWDIYSLGVMGEALFRSECKSDRHLRRILKRARADEPGERFHSAGDLLRAFSRCVGTTLNRTDPLRFYARQSMAGEIAEMSKSVMGRFIVVLVIVVVLITLAAVLFGRG